MKTNQWNHPGVIAKYYNAFAKHYVRQFPTPLQSFTKVYELVKIRKLPKIFIANACSHDEVNESTHESRSRLRLDCDSYYSIRIQEFRYSLIQVHTLILYSTKWIHIVSTNVSYMQDGGGGGLT